MKVLDWTSIIYLSTNLKYLFIHTSLKSCPLNELMNNYKSSFLFQSPISFLICNTSSTRRFSMNTVGCLPRDWNRVLDMRIAKWLSLVAAKLNSGICSWWERLIMRNVDDNGGGNDFAHPNDENVHGSNKVNHTIYPYVFHPYRELLHPEIYFYLILD